jgi:hypothetical protein
VVYAGKGNKNPKWRGGRTIDKDGYVLIFKPDYPGPKRIKCYVLEHRWKIEQKIGRLLAPGEIVHHKNNIKSDNRIKNLKLMTKKDHDNLHRPRLIKSRWKKL